LGVALLKDGRNYKVVSGHQSVGCDRGESPYSQEYETPKHSSVNNAMASYQLWLYDGKSRETSLGKKGAVVSQTEWLQGTRYHVISQRKRRTTA
jgi:hypothetical protein